MAVEPHAPALAPITEPTPLERYWYLLALTGLISVVVGVVVLADIHRSLDAFCVILGIYLLIIGAVVLVRTIVNEDQDLVGVLPGILALIAGVVVIRHPSGSLVAVSLALGIYLMVAGALDLARAITGPRRMLALLRGVVLVGLATIIISSPNITVVTLGVLAGITLCVNGALQIAEGFYLRANRGM